ncbi:MAG: hypothetical protein F6J87_02015 [Spirulina sp. SIO3F2]|nr:hypothetical protein [Spirulina sp. SIO3F2]
MEIEIIGENKDFQVIEKVIRDIDWDYDEEKPVKMPHLQAKIRLNKKAKKSYMCDISYYDCKGIFLGVDESSHHFKENNSNFPSPFSTALNIPENAERIVVTFIESEKNESLSEVLWSLAFISGLIVLISWSVKAVMEIFSS